ncbi:DUF5947 family protein [Streptomyces cinnamoneus]|uniref:Uncharacterized protein n=1 Tax=Streptomyces cinnamoneus TaxID=53446 RepID=A0A918WRB4_STRCJ|nr:DUF5947 family protein [Streptomyces cinnamoneus]GHC74042.1 hypothetical protein GCM10010507_61720 [Streptomyces cinnamoneus]
MAATDETAIDATATDRPVTDGTVVTDRATAGAAAGPPVVAARLRDLARRTAPPPARATDERCDLCAEPVPPGHRHLLDLSGGPGVLCACRACSLLFDRREAGGRHYRLLPERRLRLDGHTIDDETWATLQVPVGLAFFVRDSTSARTTVGYPSPLGVTRSTVEPALWQDVTGGHPALAGLADDVEALLVHRTRPAHEHWIVPLDDCYRLAALVRTHWKGLGGGAEVHEHVGEFFTALARPAPGRAHHQEAP